MKKMLFIVAIATLVLSACSSRSGRRNNPVQKVTELAVDSCKYDAAGNILYFSEGKVSVKRFAGDQKVIVSIDGNDIINAKEEKVTVNNIIKILDEKCTPESSPSVCLQRFKEVIEKESLDSSFIEESESTQHYDFYLKSYKITVIRDNYIPFEKKGEMTISTKDIMGEYVGDFCSDRCEWSYDQQNQLLQLLLAKKEQGTAKPAKDEPKFVLLNK